MEALLIQEHLDRLKKVGLECTSVKELFYVVSQGTDEECETVAVRTSGNNWTVIYDGKSCWVSSDMEANVKCGMKSPVEYLVDLVIRLTLINKG